MSDTPTPTDAATQDAPAAEDVATTIEQPVEQPVEQPAPDRGEQPVEQPVEPADIDAKIAEAVQAALKAAGLETSKAKPDEAEPAPKEHPAEAALKARIEADLETLGDEDRALVEEIAGDDILTQSKIYTALLKAGKISTKSDDPDDNTDNTPSKPTAKPPERIDVNANGETHPNDWKTAEAAVARAVKGLRL